MAAESRKSGKQKSRKSRTTAGSLRSGEDDLDNREQLMAFVDQRRDSGARDPILPGDDLQPEARFA
jgi:hypothetical protein